MAFRFRELVVVTMAMAMAMPATGDYSSGASVHILNAGSDPILVHCESKDSDLGAYPVSPGANYSWAFSPNIFGLTLYTCEFFWKTFTQKFQAWKGSYYDTRPPCSVTGPCNYKVTPDGSFYGLSDTPELTPSINNTDTDQQQLWRFISLGSLSTPPNSSRIELLLETLMRPSTLQIAKRTSMTL